MRAVLVMLALLACGVPAPAPSVGVLPGAAPWSAPDRAAVTEALQSMPQDRPLRTRHLDDSGRPVYTNRLLLESSPYLRQHAHNPVDWMPWGEEAFERARRENKPVLLSVGYSTCHWCHVMEEESFEDLAIAERLNRDFVAVKVDREERPDVDAVYMRAVQSLAGRGGWPMTVVMTPDGQPFFAGTYFPARSGDRGARQGFEELLVELTGRWTGDRDNLMAHAAEVSRRMEMLAKSPVPSEVPGEDAFTQATERLVASHDAARGGFGKAPKFPQPSVLRFLLAEHTRSGDPAPRDAALRTLDAILTGGIRDHVGGGFHRYSVDADWEVPHFEKMLYDQAQLVQALLDAFQLTGDERYADSARDTLDYVLREQRDPAGGFRCATDADSLSPEGERVEGWYFTWTPAELDAVLGERSRIARAWYGVTTEGNLEGRSVLSARRTVGDVAEELGVEPAALRAELDEIRKLLFRARAERPPPFQDDKVVLAWNAQMVSAFARASFVLDQPAYLEVARRAAKFANRYMTDDQGRFLRSWRDQRTSDLAVAEDYAFHALAMIDLFEASGSPDDLFLAESAVRQLDRRFGDLEVGGWYETAHDAEKLLTRGKPWSDGAQPSANGAALLAVARLHAITADDHYRERLDQGLALFGSDLARRGGASPTMLRALGFRLGRPQQVVIVPGDGVAQLHQVLRTSHDPTRIQVLVPPSLQLGGRVALVDGKVAKDGLATAYVCYAGVCEQPTTDAEQLRQQLAQTTKGMSDLRSGG